jgi:hypothetical protein
MSLSLNWPDVLKGIIVIFCTALFILLMKDALDKYRTELTSSGGRIQHSNEEKKNLPCMTFWTFCPMPGYKRKGFFYTEKTSTENSYSLEDMFNERTASFFKNESLFDVKSTTSQIFGQCYTVCCLISVPPKYNKFLYGLRSSFDIKVFIHQKWADFWLTGFGDFPIDISSVIIESNISNGMGAAVLTFSEVEN